MATKKQIAEAVRDAAKQVGAVHAVAGWEIIADRLYERTGRFAWYSSFRYRKAGEQAWRQFGRGQASFIDCLARHIL